LVVNQSRLERALAEFSHVLHTDFVVVDVLRRLCGHVASVLPAVEAGVSLDAGDGQTVVCTSGPVAERLEAAQLQLLQGPSNDVYARGWPVAVLLTSPAATGRWPHFTHAAQEMGVRSMTALPLRARRRTWGVLDIFSAAPAGLADDEARAAQTLAAAATAYVMAAEDRRGRESPCGAVSRRSVTGGYIGASLSSPLLFAGSRRGGESAPGSVECAEAGTPSSD
jgi:GAF domain-containing protein